MSALVPENSTTTVKIRLVLVSVVSIQNYYKIMKIWSELTSKNHPLLNPFFCGLIGILENDYHANDAMI